MAKENMFLKKAHEMGLLDERDLAFAADIVCTNGNVAVLGSSSTAARCSCTIWLVWPIWEIASKSWICPIPSLSRVAVSCCIPI